MTDKEFEELKKVLELMKEEEMVEHFWKNGEETWRLTDKGAEFVAEVLHQSQIEQEFKHPKTKA